MISTAVPPGAASLQAGPRPACDRCRRPLSVCWCGDMEPLATATRVVILQHPRESRVAIGTARMACVGLRSSELHQGVSFERDAAVQSLARIPGAMLLFPGEGAASPAMLAAPPPVLFVLDGTWTQARKLLARNPTLDALPRLAFVPRRPSNYRIRPEPAAHYVATVEAVVEVLAALEGDAARFQPLLRAFERMVDFQIAATTARRGPDRGLKRPRRPWWVTCPFPDFERDRTRLVVVAAEANAHSRSSDVTGDPELVQLVARRVASGESLSLLAAPSRPLAPGFAPHTGVPRDAALGAAALPALLSAWRSFLRPDDVLCTWGSWPKVLLRRAGFEGGHWVDLRSVAARRLGRRPGYADAALRAIGGFAREPWGPGRAGTAAAALAGLVDDLGEETVRGRSPGVRQR